jgi:hypothetical protein
MKESIHAKAAVYYFKAAEEHDSKMGKSKEDDDKVALRVVAAQNYFYAAINLIEALLARKEMHSFSHENRVWKVLENRELFTDGLLSTFELVDRDQRNKVAYRGENGEKYQNIKKLASEMKKHYGQ